MEKAKPVRTPLVGHFKLTAKQMDSLIPKGYLKDVSMFWMGELLQQGYTDADMTGDIDSRKSTSGYMLTYSGSSSIMAIQTAKVHDTFYYRGRIYCGN